MNEGLHFLQRAAKNEGDVRPLVALGETNRLGEVVFLEELRELRGELDGLLLSLSKVPPLRDHDGQRVDGHDGHDEDDEFGKVAHLMPKIDKREIHGVLRKVITC